MSGAEGRRDVGEFLHADDPPLSASFQSLWRVLRTPPALICSAFMAEAWVFSVLRRAGIKHARGLEEAPADGALMTSTGFAEDAELPLEHYPDVGAWSEQHHGVQFVPFDVKYMSWNNALSATLDYQHHEEGGNSARHGPYIPPVEFFILVFEGVRNEIAIVPKEAYLRARGSPRGQMAFVNGVPLWYSQFMVAVDAIGDLRAVCRSMVDAAVNGSTFENVSTRLKCHGFRPLATTTPAIYSSPNPLRQTSNDAYVKLWSQFVAKGGRIRLNQIAPFFFDFLVDMPEMKSIRFEHKFASLKLASLRSYVPFAPRGNRSAFARRRIWHVFWFDSPDGHIVITRDEVDPAWETQGVPEQAIRDHVFASFEEALEHVRRHIDQARLAADTCLQDVAADDIDLHLLFNTSDRPRKKLMSFEPTSGSSADRELDLGLPWLYTMLNRDCRAAGSGLMLPLDQAHVLGTGVFVEYHWTDDDKLTYDLSRQIPHAVYSRQLCQSRARAVALRFQDHSVKAKDFKAICRDPQRCFPLMMNCKYWRKPVEQEDGAAQTPKHVIIGSVIDAELHQKGDHRSSWYLMLPSDLTTIHECGQYRSMPDPAHKEKGGHMFMAASTHYTRAKHPAGGKFPATFDGAFVATGVDPIRYIFNAHDGTIYGYLRKILDSDGPIDLPNPQSNAPGCTFDAAAYHTDLPTVHQYSWDYGFVRGIRNKELEDENRLIPLDARIYSRPAPEDAQAVGEVY